MLARALLPLLLGAAHAVYRLELTASEGETAGKHAFAGGDNEANCKACKAVMEHVERQMAKPMYDEQGYFGGRTTKKAAKMGAKAEQAAKLNRAVRLCRRFSS